MLTFWKWVDIFGSREECFVRVFVVFEGLFKVWSWRRWVHFIVIVHIVDDAIAVELIFGLSISHSVLHHLIIVHIIIFVFIVVFTFWMVFVIATVCRIVFSDAIVVRMSIVVVMMLIVHICRHSIVLMHRRAMVMVFGQSWSLWIEPIYAGQRIVALHFICGVLAVIFVAFVVLVRFDANVTEIVVLVKCLQYLLRNVWSCGDIWRMRHR